VLRPSSLTDIIPQKSVKVGSGTHLQYKQTTSQKKKSYISAREF